MGYLKKNQQTGTVFPYMVNSISQANNAEKIPQNLISDTYSNPICCQIFICDY